jgi:exosome complex component RRP43
LLDVEDLRIWYHPHGELGGDDDMEDDEDSEDLEDGGAGGEKRALVKAYWTLYIDILFISLDGNPFDAAWAAAIAALRNVRLPHAYWDIDAEMVLCSDLLSESKKLSLSGLPVACTFAVFATGNASQGSTEKDGKRQWILADPDTFEETLCDESVSIVVDCSRGSEGPIRDQKNGTRLLSISKMGGTGIGRTEMRQLVTMAEERWVEWKQAVLESESKEKT